MNAEPDDVAETWAEELRAEAAERKANGVNSDDLSWMDSNPDRINILHWASLADREPPPRFWHQGDWLGDNPTLVAGRGGTGKTSIMQANSTALALGCEYFTAAPEHPVNVLMWCCEDSHDELWRRQVAINRQLGIHMRDLHGRLIVEARRGLDNTLFATVYGTPAFTGLREELREQIGDYRASAVILDNIGQVFGANANDGHHVTAFVNGVFGIGASVVPHFAPVFVGHVSRAQGSEFLGAAAWENACRMRWYVGPTLPDQQPEDDEQPAADVVYVAKRKANYTAKDYVRLTYADGIFTPLGVTVAAFDPAGQTAEQVVLTGFDRAMAAGIRPTDGRTSQDYLPAVIKRMNLSPSFTKRELATAMSRLMGRGELKRAAVGTYANRSTRFGLVRVIP